MNDHEWANNSLRLALQHIKDAETKPLHVEIERLRGLLRMVKDAAIERRGEDFNLTREQWASIHAALSGAGDQPNAALVEAEGLIRLAYGAIGTLRRMPNASPTYAEWQREADAWLSARAADPTTNPKDPT